KSGNDYTVTSTTYTPTSAGTYCFAASWPGDANYVGTKRDDGTNECFTVNPKQPAISTTLGTTGTVSLGTAISDTATLSGTAAKPSGSVAGGTITFYAYGPQADLGNLVCTGTAA